MAFGSSSVANKQTYLYPQTKLFEASSSPYLGRDSLSTPFSSGLFASELDFGCESRSPCSGAARGTWKGRERRGVVKALQEDSNYFWVSEQVLRVLTSISANRIKVHYIEGVLKNFFSSILINTSSP